MHHHDPLLVPEHGAVYGFIPVELSDEEDLPRVVGGTGTGGRRLEPRVVLESQDRVTYCNVFNVQ